MLSFLDQPCNHPLICPLQQESYPPRKQERRSKSCCSFPRHAGNALVLQFIFSAVAKDPVFEGGSSSITLLELKLESKNDGWNQQESASSKRRILQAWMPRSEARLKMLMWISFNNLPCKLEQQISEHGFGVLDFFRSSKIMETFHILQ